MIRYLALLGGAALFFWLTLRDSLHGKTRAVGSVILLIATALFFLYLSSVTGIGLSVQLVEWFGKAGTS